MTERHRARWARVPIAVAVAVHLALAIWVPARFEIDSAVYTTQAQSLVSHGASLDANGNPETRYPPGYPLFLATFLSLGLGYTGAVVAQHLIWVGLAIAAVGLVERGSGSPTAAAAAGLITTLDFPGIQSSISILSETLAAGTIAAAVWAAFMVMRAERSSSALRWAVFAGVMAGATALVRPIAVALGAPLALAIVVGGDHRWRWRAAVTLLAIFALFPALWTMRNARETGIATFSSLAGVNLLHYRAAATLAIRDPGGIDANLMRRREQLEALACRDLEPIYQRPCSSLSWVQKADAYADTAWPIILGDPIATGRQAMRALGMIAFGGGATFLSEVTGISLRSAQLVCTAYTVPLAMLVLAGIPYWWTRHRAFACLVLLVVGYMFGMALGAEAYSRFRVPVIVLYAVLGGGGVAWLRDRLTS